MILSAKINKSTFSLTFKKKKKNAGIDKNKSVHAMRKKEKDNKPK